jgi:hypothetical protein
MRSAFDRRASVKSPCRIRAAEAGLGSIDDCEIARGTPRIIAGTDDRNIGPEAMLSSRRLGVTI